jgi:cell wall-associated NlpC family hydrolase
MKDLIGIPYKFGGKDENGIDCYNLVKLYYSQILNTQINDNIVYKNEKDIVNVDDLKEKQNCWFKVPKITKGTLLLIEIGGFPIHVGVAVDSIFFLHILRDQTSRLEKISRWKNKIVGTYNYDSCKKCN